MANVADEAVDVDDDVHVADVDVGVAANVREI